MSDTLGPVEVQFTIPDDFGTQADAAIKRMAGLTDAAAKLPIAGKAEMIAQKQLIKEIEQDIKNLQKTADASSGKNKLNILGDVQGAKKALAEQQGTLIGMQKQQIAANDAEKESQGGVIASLSKWAAGVFTVTAALKIGKEIIASTEGSAHKYELAMTAASSSVGYFFKSVASGDWSNFFAGMDRAVTGAMDFVNAMEDINNLKNEQLIKSAISYTKVGELRAQTYETTDPTKLKRLYGEIIVEQKNNFDAEQAIRVKEREAILAKASTDSNIQQEKIKGFITEYSTLEVLIKKGEKYNNVQANRATYSRSAQPRFAFGADDVAAGKYVKQIDKITEATKRQIAESLAAEEKAKGAFDNANRRDKEKVKNIGNKEQQAADASAKKATDERNKASKEQIDYDTEIGRQRIANQIEIEQQTLNLQKDGAEKSRQQADLDFQKALVTIAQQKAEQLKKLNEVNGGIDKDTGKQTAKYVSVLPEADQKQVDAKLVLAEQARAAKIVEINKKEGEKLTELWRDINDTRLTGLEKQRALINEKYDRMAKDAEGHADLLKAIEGERLKATTVFNIKSAVEEASFQQQKASQEAELAVQGFDRESKLQKKLFDIYVYYEQLKINRLKTSPDVKDQEQAVLMQNDLDITKKNQALGDQAKTWETILGTTNQLIDGVRQYNSGLADSLQLAFSLGKTLQDAFQKGGSKMSKTDAYSAIASGVTSLVSMVVNSAKERKRASDEFYASAIKQQNDYNLLLNEELRINSEIHGNIFFKDYEGQITGSVAALNDANAKYQQGIKDFNNSEAIVGKKNVVDGNNVLKGMGAGAAVGAAVGSVVPVIGTVIGAAVGAVVGALTGLFAKKKKDIVAPLLETYPDLIKANGEFNADLAKTLIANNKVTDATKATLQNLIDWQAAAEEAKAQLVSVIQELAGSLGNDLRTALVTAFEDGTDAANAFGDSVEKVLENILSQMLFNAAFGPLLDKLQTDMYASNGLAPDGKTPLEGDPKKADGTSVIDNSWTDDLINFYKDAGPAMATFNKGLADANAMGDANGLDLFGPSDSNPASASKNSFSTMKEETGTALLGQFTALRMSNALIADIMSEEKNARASMKESLSAIAENTSYCRKLENIDRTLKTLETDGIKVR